MHIKERMARKTIQTLLPIPVDARHAEYSMLFSADDDPGRPSAFLIDLALRAIGQAQAISLDHVCSRMSEPPYYPNIWPGENYRLLAGLISTLSPKRVVEVGTGGGTSTLSMLQMLAPEARLVTFDIVPWAQYPGTLLRERDFLDGRVTQHVEDVTQPEIFAKHRALFERADFVFLDAAKDGVMEQRLLDQLRAISPAARRLVMLLDDIRVWKMLRTWRMIEHPKLDVTSFGHWCGAGLVEWGGR